MTNGAKLGFGTAALLGRISERDSLRLLDRAYDEGIRHFDTAPLYGYGRAETLVGKFAATKSDVTIATKFGLEYRGRSSRFMRLATAVARPVLRVAPGIRARAGAAARSSSPPVSQFSASVARTSLERSLAALGRDSIDIFFLHECRPPDLDDPALLAFLEDSVRTGTIRSFGLGTDAATVAFAIEHAERFSRVLQFENNRRHPNVDRYKISAAGRTLITHTPFGGVGSAIDGTPADNLAFALRDNPEGIVLFSTSNPARIAQNCEIARSTVPA